MLYLAVMLVVFAFVHLYRAHQARVQNTVAYETGLFWNNYVDTRVFFVKRFKTIPTISVITEVDSTAAYALIKGRLGEQILDAYQLCRYDYESGKAQFLVTVLVLSGDRMIEIGTEYVELLHRLTEGEWANELLAALAECRTMPAVEAEDKAPTVIGFGRSIEMN